mmetsp:Transcript_86388/g.230769  ORF Transcript_86388/g.230769 Transcript_86388/m.230769 type:complete len:238 (+) Transcript_86388:1067-1780(+)
MGLEVVPVPALDQEGPVQLARAELRHVEADLLPLGRATGVDDLGHAHLVLVLPALLRLALGRGQGRLGGVPPRRVLGRHAPKDEVRVARPLQPVLGRQPVTVHHRDEGVAAAGALAQLLRLHPHAAQPLLAAALRGVGLGQLAGDGRHARAEYLRQQEVRLADEVGGARLRGVLDGVGGIPVVQVVDHGAQRLLRLEGVFHDNPVLEDGICIIGDGLGLPNDPPRILSLRQEEDEGV